MAILKGRGAQRQMINRFDSKNQEWIDEFLEYCHHQGEEHPENKRTKYQYVHPKSIINKVSSPDVGPEFSMNPYQGCEHGCIYCYARNTHEYWGYNAGLDFERIIMVKKNAPELLEEKLNSKNWIPKTISLSGNTDCYQPAERNFLITRNCLKVFLKYRHPVCIITKNALVLRDLDILHELATLGLCTVVLSITTLNEELRRILEPRTSSSIKRLEALTKLHEAGIPCMIMMAPIIPGLNSHEILEITKKASEHGALGMGFTLVRLNGALGELFTDWIRKTLPDKAEKVLHQIAECHQGRLNDSSFGRRMKGDGTWAAHLHQQVHLAKNLYFKKKELPLLRTDLFHKNQSIQMRLF